MLDKNVLIEQLRGSISRERKILNELSSLFNHYRNADSPGEKRMISSQTSMLKNELRKTGNEVIANAEKIFVFKPLKSTEEMEELELERNIPVQNQIKRNLEKTQPESVSVKDVRRVKPDSLEKLTLSRMRKKGEKISKTKERKPRKYVKFVPAAYVSVIFFSTVLSFFAAIFIMLFFLFFNLVALPPFIVPVEGSLAIRFLKVFWLLFAIPGVTLLFAYFYPTMEKKSSEGKINQELPFAVVHMSAISSSMIEPSKIFNIIISTKEYPALEKEFIKIQNEINVYGYDLVTALRNRSFNSPSKKLSELFNGLATTINSGGDLPEFFEKRSQSLLFDHRLEKEKQAKASETFMDIYISAVIAAPMILMLLLMMMRISGLGISLSTGMISLIMILAVSLINILFLAFLHIKQPEGA